MTTRPWRESWLGSIKGTDVLGHFAKYSQTRLIRTPLIRHFRLIRRYPPEPLFTHLHAMLISPLNSSPNFVEST